MISINLISLVYILQQLDLLSGWGNHIYITKTYFSNLEISIPNSGGNVEIYLHNANT